MAATALQIRTRSSTRAANSAAVSESAARKRKETSTASQTSVKNNATSSNKNNKKKQKKKKKKKQKQNAPATATVPQNKGIRWQLKLDDEVPEEKEDDAGAEQVSSFFCFQTHSFLFCYSGTCTK